MGQGSKPKLALGTAQFGLDYGISNRDGQTSREDVKKIIRYAINAGIQLFDTAPAYGDSERLLGEYLTDTTTKITTKIGEINCDSIENDVITNVSSQFFESLIRLRRETIYGLLLHGGTDLLKLGSDKLYRMLVQLKDSGLVKKIGVSVYRKNELAQILDRYQIDFVQLPVSIYDQSFVQEGYAKDLRQKYGLELHSRSTFLQGLILMDFSEIPDHMAVVRDHHKKIQSLAVHEGLTPLEIATNFVEGLEEIDLVVYGVVGLNQLKSIVSTRKFDIPQSIINEAAVHDSNLVDPRRW